MSYRLKFILTQVLYDLRTGLIFRPAIITLSYFFFALIMLYLEEKSFINLSMARWVPWGFQGETSSAQIVVGTLAGAIITITTIIYSILIMALSMASVQFSPRILNSFMRDHVNQNVIGMFAGTFIYFILVLRTIHSEPVPFVPDFSISVGIFLALLSLGNLLYFIHYISLFIQVNYILEHIVKDTEKVMDTIFPEKIIGHSVTEIFAEQHLTVPEGSLPIPCERSGYIQLIDDKSLGDLAKKYGVKIFVRSPVGGFVIDDAPLFYVFPGDKIDDKFKALSLRAFDIGCIRTMQQDVVFGVRQIVDISLKALSPAVNDPCTAVTCIDNLSRLLIRLAGRKMPPWEIRDPASGELLVFLRRINFNDVLDLAFTQIRYYGKSDIVVCMNMMRMFKEIASFTKVKKYHKRILYHASLVEEEGEKYFSSSERKELSMILEDIKEITS